MSKLDFTALTGALTSPDVRDSVSQGFTPPNGGGNTVRIFNSTVATLGVAGEYYNADGFSPTPDDKGMLIQVAFKKANVSSGDKCAAMVFIMLEGDSTTDVGYILGLTDSVTPRLCLRKGSLAGGLPAGAVVGEQGVLALSTATFALDTWIHVQFQAVVNVGSDTVIQVKTNDLTAHSVLSPVWTYPAGMKDLTKAFDVTFVDDAAGVASGSPGLTTGRGGKAMWTNAANRRVFFDAFEIVSQP